MGVPHWCLQLLLLLLVVPPSWAADGTLQAPGPGVCHPDCTKLGCAFRCQSWLQLDVVSLMALLCSRAGIAERMASAGELPLPLPLPLLSIAPPHPRSLLQPPSSTCPIPAGVPLAGRARPARSTCWRRAGTAPRAQVGCAARTDAARVSRCEPIVPTLW